jgi:hypothetical protein
MTLKRLISVLLVFCLLAPARVYANDDNVPPIQQPAGEKDPGNVLTVVKKDHLVPFTGILLSPRAVAELLAKMELAKKEAELAAMRAREEQRVRDEAEIKGLKIELDAEKKTAEERLAIRDNRLAELQKDLAKAEADRPNPLTWTLVGAGATAILIGTLATVILVGGAK